MTYRHVLRASDRAIYCECGWHLTEGEQHKVQVFLSPVSTGWIAWCQSNDCIWTRISFGPKAWQSAVGKALAHVDETKEQT